LPIELQYLFYVFSAYLKENLSLRAVEKKVGRSASGLSREIKQQGYQS